MYKWVFTVTASQRELGQAEGHMSCFLLYGMVPKLPAIRTNEHTHKPAPGKRLGPTQVFLLNLAPAMEI